MPWESTPINGAYVEVPGAVLGALFVGGKGTAQFTPKPQAQEHVAVGTTTGYLQEKTTPFQHFSRVGFLEIGQYKCNRGIDVLDWGTQQLGQPLPVLFQAPRARKEGTKF